MMRTTTTEERDPITARVVNAIAATTGTDPIDLYPPLYYSIDTDALERLFKEGADVRLQFDYDGRSVVVEGDGTVTVDGTVHEAK